MRLTSKSLAVLVLGLIFGGIAFSSWMGWWLTESSKVPVRFQDGNVSGEYNPADIRGSYTFGEISSLFGIPLEDLTTAFDLSPELASTTGIKDLETQYSVVAESGTEIGTGSVRLFVAYYTGLPYEADGEYLLAPAVKILKEKATLSEDQLTYLAAHVVSMDEITEPWGSVGESGEEINHTPEPKNLSGEAEHDADSEIIKGKTTFREILDWGLTAEEIETVIGQPMPNPLTAVKDFSFEKGLSYGTIKAELQAMLDALP